MMFEYGEQFWKSNWDPLYGFLGGNPLAAMPSLHFATSVQAAHVLSETGAVAGAVGWAYASTLGVALVYLGEHYVVDLAAGLALTRVVRARRAARRAAVPGRRHRGAAARGGGARVNTTETRHQSPNTPAPEDDDGPRGAPAPARHLGAQPRRLRGLRRARDRRALLPAPAGRRPGGDVAPARGRQPDLARARARLHGRDVRRLRAAVPRRLRARGRGPADRWRESYQICMAGAGGDAAVLRRRRRRDRADRVGDAPRRACAAAWWPTRRSRSSSSPTSCTRCAGRLRLRAALRRLPGPRPVHDDRDPAPPWR